MPTLDAMAEALLEQETLDADEIAELFCPSAEVAPARRGNRSHRTGARRRAGRRRCLSQPS